MILSDIRIFKLGINCGKIYRPLESVLVALDSDEGTIGYGVAHHPIPDEKEIETLKFLRKVKSSLIGYSLKDIKGIHELLDQHLPVGKNAA